MNFYKILGTLDVTWQPKQQQWRSYFGPNQMERFAMKLTKIELLEKALTLDSEI